MKKDHCKHTTCLVLGNDDHVLTDEAAWCRHLWSTVELSFTFDSTTIDGGVG